MSRQVSVHGVFALVASICFAHESSAQFGTRSGSGDRRVDSNPAISSNPAIAISGRRVYVVWEDFRQVPGWGDLYFNRALDGHAWLGETALESDPAVSATAPVVATSDDSSVVFVVWRGGSLSASHVYCRASPDSGLSWTPAVVVDTGDAAYDPKIVVSGFQAVLTWSDQRDDPTLAYVYARRVSLSWPSLVLGSEVRLDPTDAGYSWTPEIAADGSSVYVTWNDQGRAYFARSTDSGVSWGSAQEIGGAGSVYLPQISASGAAVYATWYQSVGSDIYFNRSLDGGTTWLPSAQRLDTSSVGTSLYPDIASEGSWVYVVWTDSRAALGDVYLRRSNNAGATWSPEIVLDSPNLSPTGESYGATISLAKGIPSVTWEEGSAGQRDIYCSRLFNGSWIPVRLDTTGPSAAVNSTHPRGARTPLGSYVVWMDNRDTPGSPGDIYFEFIRP